MKYVVYTLLLFSFFACRSKDKAEIVTEKLSNGTTLGIELGLPISISGYENYLFVTDLYSEDGMIQIIDAEKECIVNSFAVKGNGPNEFLTVSNVDFVPMTDRKFYVFDQGVNKVSIFDFDSLVCHKQKYPQTIQDVDTEIRFYEIQKSRNGYIAAGIMENKKFALLNDSLQLVEETGSYCPKPSPNVPDITHAIANYGKFFVAPDRKSLINIIYAAGIITCYDIHADGSLSLRWENVVSKMDYTLKDDSFVNNGVMGYLSVSYTNKYIYALYSGLKEDNESIATYGQEIHVYDFDGNMVKKYLIDTPALGICVTPDDRCIYTIVHTPESGLMKYTL